jgi:ABC-2 type transport system ATP-binding protein
VSKVYGRGRSQALAGIDLEIPSGSITALVGPNGAGKSTLMKAWVGFERPTTGVVTVSGFDPFRRREMVLARVGYIAQSAALYRDLTVGDHLDLAASLRRTFDRTIAARRLDDLSIPLRRQARTLSGGQQAQVSLAIILGCRSEVLLLDEPLAELDPLARREFLYVLVAAVRGSGATVVLTSHVVTDIEQAADRLVVLSNGLKLLDADVSVARTSHRVLEGADLVGDATEVAAYLAPGGVLHLHKTTESVGRAATLEDVVLGYLAVGRQLRVEPVQSAPAES